MKWRQRLHLEPPKGWLNDPNGLCWFQGNYHVYFQYAPDHADGSGRKCWGHYESSDLLHWSFTGTVLFPDHPCDRDGVYSGSALASGDMLALFYTGNVKEKGRHDYITSGRGANVMLTTTRDGHTMSEKKVLLTNRDYPDFCSCHVRDPKVWKEDGICHMVLGARRIDDTGCVLFYESEDLERWRYAGCADVPDFGYMWECPDCFVINGNRYLSVSPQGLAPQDAHYQNVYSSGYFRYDKRLYDFCEWDYGFDWYAPQTFEAPDGRRIIIGWMGIGDIPYTNPTAQLGWQHCLTIPREITADADGVLYQNPIRELALLRKREYLLKNGGKQKRLLPFDMTAQTEGTFEITISEGLQLLYDAEQGRFSIVFQDPALGCGRTIRNTELDRCKTVRILADRSSLEIYLDGGRRVLSTRFYPESEEVELEAKGAEFQVYEMDGLEVAINGE